MEGGYAVMNIEKELEEAMATTSEWKGSPDQMWQRVESEIHRSQTRRKWSIPVWATGAVAAAIIGVIFVQVERGPVQSVPPVATGPNSSTGSIVKSLGGQAIVIPAMNGIVAEIKDGYLVLRDVTYSLNLGDPKPEPRVPIAKGRWITQTHWQTDDGSLDLFRGQSVSYFLDQKSFMPDIQPTHGVVQKVDGDTIELEVYDGDSGRPLTWHRVGVQTFRLSPHSRRGGHGDREDQMVTPGDRMVVLWYGEPSDQVVWQYTFTN
jgi:hypothetical protein